MGRKRRSEKKKKKSPRQLLRYSTEAMLDAIRDVQNGKSVASAAREHGVPRVSLYYKAKGIRPIETRMGPDAVLSLEVENRIVDWIVKSARTGFPVTKQNLCDSVKKLLDDSGKETPFNNNRPGRKWYDNFLKRHPGLSERMSQNLTSSRAKVTSSDLVQWSESILQFLTENDQCDILDDPTRLFNGDETAFFLNPKGSTVLAPKGDKTVYQTVNSDEKECLTVLITANASGKMAPPLIVYKYERIPADIAASVPGDWAIGKSESGWMNGSLFYEYITNSFHPWLLLHNIQLPVIFFLDGHVSHLNLQTAQFCHDNGIILISLYPNATHLIQPMDVAVFRSLKGAWRRKVHDWRLENMGNPTLKKRDFAPLLEEVLSQVDPQIITNGFRKCGLYPWSSGAAIKQLSEKETTPMLPVNAISTKHVFYAREFVEKFLGPQKLKVFRTYNSLSCVPSDDRALFELWKETLTSPGTHLFPAVQDTGTPSPTRPELLDETSSLGKPCSSNQHAAQSESILETQQATSSVSPMEVQHVSDPEQLVLPNAIPATEPNQDTATLPSPFKRAFLYPEPGPSKPKNPRKKELFPSVVSSQAWRDYHEKKEKQKQENELKKKERALERQRKKIEKEELQKKKKEELQKRKKANREEKGKSKHQVTTRGRKKKRPLPSSSSESEEEWQPSDDGDGVREEADHLQSLCQENAEEQLLKLNNDQETGQSNIAPEIFKDQSNEDSNILSLFDVTGLDIEAQEITGPSNDIIWEAATAGYDELDRDEQDVPIIDTCDHTGEHEGRPANEKTKIRAADEEIFCAASLEEGQFVLTRFKKGNGQVELLCRVKSIFADGCDVVTMTKISRIGEIYNENVKDMRKIKRDQVLKVLQNPSQFGSNFQFNSTDLEIN